ncbi:MAG: hypothetical protein ACXWRE_17210 [Pseudobdellovibrionaceae bacterium]
MRSFQFFFITVLALIVGLSLMSGSFSANDAQAASIQKIPKIQIQKLGNFKGQYLTVFYAMGTRPFWSSGSAQATLSEIRVTKTEFITSSFITLPEIELQKKDFQPVYNLAMMVISPRPGFSFVNADGSTIKGMTETQNHQATLLRTFSKAEIESLMTGQGLENGLILTLD